MMDALENGTAVRYSNTATAIGDDEATLQNLARSRGVDGHDVIVHGTIVDGEGQFKTNGMLTHPRQIADAVLENPAYFRGTPINLVTCYGYCGPAQELQSILKVPVKSYPGLVDLDPGTGVLRDLR